MIDDEDEDEVLNKGITLKSVFKNVMIILLMVIGAIFLYLGIAPDQTINIFVGFVFICLGATLIQIQKPEREPVRQTLTILKCQICDITKVRHYEDGDYVFDKKEACDKCKELLEIKQIYSVKLKNPKAKIVPKVP